MSKYVPLKDFVWSDNILTEQDILNLSDESDEGYILEVDLDYPSDLHIEYSDFLLAPENKPPQNRKEVTGYGRDTPTSRSTPQKNVFLTISLSCSETSIRRAIKSESLRSTFAIVKLPPGNS
ncbi:hypothetical protein NPIL_146061 [Nephila pilipes]|uniref:Uncharacterized protein n=1 Tax=Nephila pilipes TaxID=299642 RepID=A0A8X6Q6G4_NEPPI|nr:hypothetical protein NPIL_146061 [Nephila pilipes]